MQQDTDKLPRFQFLEIDCI